MKTVKCQYTGIEFEAESNRTKNHPAVTAFLSGANDDGKYTVGAYAQAKQLVSEVNGQFTEIDAAMVAVRAAYADWKNGARNVTVVTYKQRLAIGNAQVAGIMAARGENEESMDFAGATAFKTTYGFDS